MIGRRAATQNTTMAATPKKPQPKAKARGKGAGTAEAERRADAFVVAYGRTGNATQAAAEAGYSAKSAKQAGARLLSDTSIRDRAAEARAAYLAEQEDDKKRQRKMLVEAADDAIRALHQVVQGGVTRGAVAMVSAATAILDRAGHKPVDESKIDHSSRDGTMTPKAPTQIIIEGE